MRNDTNTGTIKPLVDDIIRKERSTKRMRVDGEMVYVKFEGSERLYNMQFLFDLASQMLRSPMTEYIDKQGTFIVYKSRYKIIQCLYYAMKEYNNAPAWKAVHHTNIQGESWLCAVNPSSPYVEYDCPEGCGPDEVCPECINERRESETP